MEFKFNKKYPRKTYMLTCDLEQKDYINIGGVDLRILNNLSNDHRNRHPDIGTIVECNEGCQFSVGQRVLTRHFVFTDYMHNSNHIGVINGENIFLSDEQEVMFGITEDDELVPRDGIILCEPVYGKFINTTIHVTSDMEGARRDLVRAITNYKDIKKGDYLYIAYGADYHFKWKGKDYIRVDFNRDDVLLRVDCEEWVDPKVRKHLKGDIAY